MKLLQTLSILAGFFTTQLNADTIILKTGKKYNGTVISEDSTSYLIEIQITKTIKDKRKFLKTDVAEIIEETKAEKDYKTLSNLTPTPDQLNTENYQTRITKAQAFIAKHPKSPEEPKVRAALAILERELDVISKGGTKLNGKLISADEVKTNAYDIHAVIISNKIKKLRQQGRHQQALRKWEELKNNYPHSAAYVDIAPSITAILQSYQRQLSTHLSTLDARIAKRNNLLKTLSDSDRRRAEQTITQKQATYEARIQKEEKELKTRWLTIDPYHKRALEYNQRNIKSELQSLSRKSSSKIQLAGPSYRGSWAALASGNLDEASKLLKTLKSLKLPDSYTAPLITQLTQKKAAADKAAAEKKEQERIAKEEADKAAREAAEKAAEAAKKKKKSKKRSKTVHPTNLD